MFKTLDIDRNTIERKYHNPDEEFNSFMRMWYHGYDYDETTGLDDAKMKEGLSALSEKLEGQPHPIHKAKLFEYVLDHTRIDINEHDYFIGIYSWGRPISEFTVMKWSDDVYRSYPEEANTLKRFDDSGTTRGWLDFDHTVPDWDALMTLGFKGILSRAQKSYESLKNAGTLTEKQEHFFRGVEIEYKAIIRFVDRLYNYALTKNFEKAPRIVKCLKNLRDGAPTDFYEVLQLIYIYFMLSESVDHYQVRSLGHGLDGTLYPYFKKDLESGKYTKEELTDFLGYFLMQWSSIGNYWGQPFYLGGTNLDGSTKVNELSYLILDVYDKLGIYNPKIQIKKSDSTPKDFVLKALDMIRHGINSIVFCNEEIAVKCLMAHGSTYEAAVDFDISGCYEYKTKGKGIGISSIFVNVLKPVTLVFENGFDSMFGEEIGLKTGDVENFKTFEEFYEAYHKQLTYCIDTHINAIYKQESRVQEINPSLMFSGTIGQCVDTLTDALDTGISNNTTILLSGLGTAVDALMAVYELVFEKKLTTMAELKKALENNWEGYEALRKQALSAGHKYGNGDTMSDYYANAITRVVADKIHGRRNAHGGRYGLEIHSARAFVYQGERTAATPDGRKKGEEMSKNASPTPGADRKGITALIKSATTIDATLPNVGCCLDAMLHPSAVQGEDGLEAFYAVLETYMKRGGASIHFNVFSADMLRDAQAHPEKYENLQVRVCGWNVLWNNMDKKEQDAYILRAENMI